MEKEIIRKIMKECNPLEKIIIKLFKGIFIKVYHISRINTVNSILKNSIGDKQWKEKDL